MGKRSYGQRCSLAYGMDMLGERWTLLIFRELLVRPARFRDLEEGLAGIGTNLLSSRLKDLEAAGLVEREDNSRQAPYRLTPAGREIEPAILELIRWGYRHARPEDEHLHRDHWDLLAMKAFFRPDRCSRKLVVQFASDALNAWVEVSPRGFSHAFGSHASPDARIEGTIDDFRRARAQGRYRDNDVLGEFAACFALPAATPTVS